MPLNSSNTYVVGVGESVMTPCWDSHLHPLTHLLGFLIYEKTGKLHPDPCSTKEEALRHGVCPKSCPLEKFHLKSKLGVRTVEVTCAAPSCPT